MLDAKLVIVGGGDSTVEYLLSLPASIGRGQENDIPLPHPLVSRKHCELFEREGQLFVRDSGSLNGTFIGNQPVDGEGLMSAGQLLTVGTVTFRVVIDGMAGGHVLDDAGHRAEDLHAEDAGDAAAKTMIGNRRSSTAEAKPQTLTDTTRHRSPQTDTQRFVDRGK